MVSQGLCKGFSWERLKNPGPTQKSRTLGITNPPSYCRSLECHSIINHEPYSLNYGFIVATPQALWTVLASVLQQSRD